MNELISLIYRYKKPPLVQFKLHAPIERWENVDIPIVATGKKFNCEISITCHPKYLPLNHQGFFLELVGYSELVGNVSSVNKIYLKSHQLLPAGTMSQKYSSQFDLNIPLGLIESFSGKYIKTRYQAIARLKISQTHSVNSSILIKVVSLRYLSLHPLRPIPYNVCVKQSSNVSISVFVRNTNLKMHEMALGYLQLRNSAFSFSDIKLLLECTEVVANVGGVLSKDTIKFEMELCVGDVFSGDVIPFRVPLDHDNSLVASFRGSLLDDKTMEFSLQYSLVISYKYGLEDFCFKIPISLYRQKHAHFPDNSFVSSSS